MTGSARPTRELPGHAPIHRQCYIYCRGHRIGGRLDLATRYDVEVANSKALARGPVWSAIAVFLNKANAFAPDQKRQYRQARRQCQHHPEHHSLKCRHQRPHALTYRGARGAAHQPVNS